MNLAIQIEDAELEARMLDSMVLAVEYAIYNGVNSHTDYEYALHAVAIMAHEHMEHMKALMEKSYELQRAETGGKYDITGYHQKHL